MSIGRWPQKVTLASKDVACPKAQTMSLSSMAERSPYKRLTQVQILEGLPTCALGSCGTGRDLFVGL